MSDITYSFYLSVDAAERYPFAVSVGYGSKFDRFKTLDEATNYVNKHVKADLHSRLTLSVQQQDLFNRNI